MVMTPKYTFHFNVAKFTFDEDRLGLVTLDF